MSELAPERLRDACIEFAREAGAIVRDGYGRAHTPDRKGKIDLVTEYDTRSEALLVDRIRARFPTHAILAEESGAHELEGSEARWLIDPLDGTTNFAHNYPFFAVSIAVEVRGQLAAGVVYDPVRDETFAAAAGDGATLNGATLQVSDIDKVNDALIVTGFPYDIRERPERSIPLFQAFLTRAQGIRRDGSAAMNLSYLAAGRFDGMWESGLAAWDVGAGALLVREAGGQVTDYNGGAFGVEGRQILASNGKIHGEMRAILAEAAAAMAAGARRGRE